MHDVFICYDENDKLLSDVVCRVFEDNNIKCWIKSRDYSSNDSVDTISRAIMDSKCLVLIYSNNSKNSDYVLTEVDIAFTEGVEILVFNIDNSNRKGNSEFFLKNKDFISALPNPAEQLKALVSDTSKLLKRPVGKTIISSRDSKEIERLIPKPKDYTKYVKVAVPIIIGIVLIFYFFILPMGQHTTDDGNFTMKITDVGVSDVNGEYSYTVYGESYNLPNDPFNYIMKTKYYDAENNEVYSINSTADEFRSGKITSFEVPQKNITKVTFELVDLKDNVLCEDEFKIK
ncbi:toll/interleukin-1 receptor domain-containing protein [Methanobrevibacter sp.]|uniref:toll/interleukin-1 receptor domain-containing protein n=1 Tax=Methanobrevibacter sp. TaxID=66852 RepID=UPI0038901B99